MSRKYNEIASQSIPRIEERSVYALPSPDLEYLFKITGKILVTGLVGEVMESPEITGVYNMVISGTSGQGVIDVNASSLPIVFDTDIETTVDNFILSNEAALLAGGVVISKVGEDTISFSPSTPIPFTVAPAFTNDGGDLDGTVTAVVADAVLVKLISNPSVGSDADMCDRLDIINLAVGSLIWITGNPANAMQKTTGGCGTYNPFKMIVHGGTIDLDIAVTPEKGMIKWTLHYIPIDVDAKAEPIHKYWYQSL